MSSVFIYELSETFDASVRIFGRDFAGALAFEDPNQRAGLRGFVSRQHLWSGDEETLLD